MAPVFYRLETSGPNPQCCEVLQIAARCGKETFSCYLLPQFEIDPEATARNHLYVSPDGQRLCKNGRDLDAVDAKPAWQGFINFLKYCGGRSAVLVAHDGTRLSHPILMRCVRELGLESSLLEGDFFAADTMSLFPRDDHSRGLAAIAARNGLEYKDYLDLMQKLCKADKIRASAQPLEYFDW